jgi:hypothetical protein
MSADDLPELPPDARDALTHAKRLEGPGDAVRARMKARLVAALPPLPDGGGGDGGGEAGTPPGAGAGALGALPKVPLWVAAAALVVGGAAGLLYPRTPVEHVVVMHGPPLTVSTPPAPLPVAPPSATAVLPTVDMKDLPLVPVAAADAGPARGDDLAAERAALDVARTALGRGDGANALAACDEHARKYPRGALAEEREAIAVQALVLEHRGDDARARAERFRKAHPRSILLPAVLAAAGIDP